MVVVVVVAVVVVVVVGVVAVVAVVSRQQRWRQRPTQDARHLMTRAIESRAFAQHEFTEAVST